MMKSLCVFAFALAMAGLVHGQTAPTVTLGGDVVDGEISAHYFYSAAGADIIYTFCNGRVVGGELAGDVCDQFDNNGDGWDGDADALALLTLAAGCANGNGENQVSQTYSTTSDDGADGYWITEDQTFTFTLQDGDVFQEGWGNQHDSYATTTATLVVIAAGNDPDDACTVSFSNTDVWDFYYGGVEITFTSKVLGAITEANRASFVDAITSTSAAWSPSFTDDDAWLVGYTIDYTADGFITFDGGSDEEDYQAMHFWSDWVADQTDGALIISEVGASTQKDFVLSEGVVTATDGLVAGGPSDEGSPSWLLEYSGTTSIAGGTIEEEDFGSAKAALCFDGEGDGSVLFSNFIVFGITSGTADDVDSPSSDYECFHLAAAEASFDDIEGDPSGTITVENFDTAVPKGGFLIASGASDHADEDNCNYLIRLDTAVAAGFDGDLDIDFALSVGATGDDGASVVCGTDEGATITLTHVFVLDEDAVMSFKVEAVSPAATDYSRDGDDEFTAIVGSSDSWLSRAPSSDVTCDGSETLAGPSCSLFFDDGDDFRSTDADYVEVTVEIDGAFWEWDTYADRLDTVTITDKNSAGPSDASFESIFPDIQGFGMDHNDNVHNMNLEDFSTSIEVDDVFWADGSVYVIKSIDNEDLTDQTIMASNVDTTAGESSVAADSMMVQLVTTSNTAVYLDDADNLELYDGVLDDGDGDPEDGDLNLLHFTSNNGIEVGDIVMLYNVEESFDDSAAGACDFAAIPVFRVLTVEANGFTFEDDIVPEDAVCLSTDNGNSAKYVALETESVITVTHDADTDGKFSATEGEIVIGDVFYFECPVGADTITGLDHVSGFNSDDGDYTAGGDANGNLVSDCDNDATIDVYVIKAENTPVQYLTSFFATDDDYWRDADSVLEFTLAAGNLKSSSSALTCTSSTLEDFVDLSFDLVPGEEDGDDWQWTDYYKNTITETILRDGNGEQSGTEVVVIFSSTVGHTLNTDETPADDIGTAATAGFQATTSSSAWDNLRDASTGCALAEGNIACLFGDGDDEDVLDFDITSPLTITFSMEFASDFLVMDEGETEPAAVGDIVEGAEGELVIYPDGLLDPATHYWFSTVGDNAIAWVNGPHVNDIAFSVVVCGGAESYWENGILVGAIAIPPSNPYIDGSDFYDNDDSDFPDAGDTNDCRLVIGDTRGNVMTTKVTGADEAGSDDVPVLDARPHGQSGSWVLQCAGETIDGTGNTCGGGVNMEGIAGALGKAVPSSFDADTADTLFGQFSDDDTISGVNGDSATDYDIYYWSAGLNTAVISSTYSYVGTGMSSFEYSIIDLDESSESHDAFTEHDADAGYLKIHGLTAGHTYEVALKLDIEDSIDADYDAFLTHFTMTASVPGPAGMPMTSGVGSTSLTVYWLPPRANGGLAVTKYTLQCTTSTPHTSSWDDFGSLAVNAETTATDQNGNLIPQITVSGLTANTLYVCRVVSSNEAGDSYGFVRGMMPHNFAWSDDAWDSLSLPDASDNLSIPGVLKPYTDDEIFRYVTYENDEFEVELSEDEEESMTSDDYIHYTDGLLTAYSSASKAIRAHPPVDFAATQEHDGDDFKITYTWSTNNDEGSDAGEVGAFSHWQVRTYSADDAGVAYQMTDEADFNFCGDNEFVVCGEEYGDLTECDVIVDSGNDYYLEPHQFTGIRVTPVLGDDSDDHQGQESFYFVYLHGADSSSDTTGVSICDQPDYPLEFDPDVQSYGWDEDDHIYDLSSTEVGAPSTPVWDTPWEINDFSWTVWDINRDAAYVTFDLPCIYESDGSTGEWDEITVDFDSGDEDTFHEDWLVWTEDVDSDDDTLAFTPYGLEEDQTYNDVVITFTDSTGDIEATHDASLDLGTTLTWRYMRPLRTHAPEVAAVADDVTSLTVTWEAPVSDGGSPIRYYQVRVRSDSEGYEYVEFADDETELAVTQDTVAEDLTATIADLEGGRDYYVQVRSCNRQVFEADSDYALCSPWSSEGHGRTTAPTQLTSGSVAVATTACENGVTITATVTPGTGVGIASGEILCMDATLWGTDQSVVVAEQVDGIWSRLGNADADADTPGRFYYDAEDLVYSSQLIDLADDTNYKCNLHAWDTFGGSFDVAFEFTTPEDEDATACKPLGVTVNDDADTISYVVPAGPDGEVAACDAVIVSASSDGTCGGAPSDFADDDGTQTNIAVDGTTSGESDSSGSIADADFHSASSNDFGFNEYFCAYVECDGTASDGYWFESPSGYPSDDATLEVLDNNDVAALFRITPPTTDGGDDITEYTIVCANDSEDVEATVDTTDFNEDADGELVYEYHVSGFVAEETYSCTVVATNGNGFPEGGDAGDTTASSVSFTTSATTGGVDGVRQMPLQPRQPHLHSSGVVAEFADGEDLTRDVVTHMSIRVEWEDLCDTADTAAECYGSVDVTFVDADTTGTDAKKYERTAPITTAGLPDDGTGDVEIVANILKVTADGGDPEYHWYPEGTTETGTDEFNHLKGSTTYTFAVGHVSNYLPFLRENTLDDVQWSTELSVTTEAPSAPDTPKPVTVDDSDAGWHTRSALFIDVEEYGDGYNLLSSNGDVVTKFTFECRPTDDTTSWSDSSVKKGSVTAVSGHPAPTSGSVVALASTEEYKCRAQAHSASGSSGWSATYDAVTADTQADAVSAPLRMHSPVITASTSDSISLAWRAPDDDDGKAVVGYRIGGSVDHDTEDGDVVSFIVTGLDPYTEYSFTLAAYNKLDFGCDEDVQSVDSESVTGWTTLLDDTLGQADTFVLPEIAETTIGSTVVLVEFDDSLDLASGSANAYLDLEYAEVAADSDALTWDEFSAGVDSMYDSGLLAGWAMHHFRYLTGLTAETDYQIRFVGQVQPSHPLGADAPVLTTFGDVTSVTTEAEPVPMPPIPVAEDGETYVEASVEGTVNNTPGQAKYITFDISDGTASPETGASDGTETEVGYLVATSAGSSTAKTATSVDTKSSTGHFSIDDPDNEGSTISSLTTLKADTEYAFSIRYTDTNGDQGPAFDDFVRKTTTCGHASTVSGVALVSTTSITAHAALLKWNEPATKGSDIVSYTIQCYTESDLSDTAVSETNIPADWTTWYIDGLDEDTEYYCRVSAVAETTACNSEDAETGTKITTRAVDPLAPLKSLPPYIPTCDDPATAGLTASTEQATTEQLEVAWPYFSSASALKGASGFQSGFGHDFQWKTNSMSSYVTEEHDEDDIVTITGIDAAATYSFRVRAVNDNAVGEWSEILTYPNADDGEIDGTPPDTPSNIMVHDEKRASIFLTWEILDNGGAEVDEVHIQCKRGPAVGDDTDDWAYETVTDDPSDGVVWLKEENVRAPSSVDAENFGLDEDDDSFEYFCRLQASNKHGDSSWSAPVSSGDDIPTAQGHPLAPGRPQLVDEPGVDSVKIRFLPSVDDDGSPIRGYYLHAEGFETVEKDAEDFGTYEDGDGEMDGGDQFVEIEFTGLSPDTEYTFYSQAYNRHIFENSNSYEETSTDSPSISIFTAGADRPAAPSAPVFQDTLVTQTGFSWTLPDDNGSPITEMRIHCAITLTETPEADADASVDPEPVDLPTEEQTPYDADVEEVICDSSAECEEDWRLIFAVDGFSAETDYHCVLSATNAYGTTFGEPSTYTQVTMQAEADEDTDQLPLFIQPTISGVTDTTLTVNWAHPFGASGLTYSVSGDQGAGTFSDISSTSQQFTALEPNTMYTFTISTTSGVSTGLTGGYVKTVSGWTDSGVPSAVTGLSAVDTTQTGALLSWDAADSVGSAVTGYTIGCDSDAGETLDILNSDFIPREDRDDILYGYINGLEADTSYKCKVHAINDNGDGDWAASAVTVKTQAEDATLPITSLPPYEIDDESGESDPHEFSDGHLTSPVAIKLAFGTEVLDTDDDFTDGLGNNGGSSTNVAGYIVRWGIDGAEMNDLFLHAGDTLDEEDQFYIFTGLQGGTDYAFSVKSFTEDPENNHRHEPEEFSAPIVIETAEYIRQDVPDLPVELDVSEEVLFVRVDGHDNGSPIDSQNEYEVKCRPSTGDYDHDTDAVGKSSTPYVYVRRPAKSDETKWICKAEVTNHHNGQKVKSGWSYDSWVMTLEAAAAGPEPLMSVPPMQINGTSNSATVTFHPPPLAGGVETPSVSSIALYWMDMEAWEALSDENQENPDSFTDSVDKGFKWWCDNDADCINAALAEHHEELEFEYMIEDLVGNSEYTVALQTTAGTLEATQKVSPLSEVGCVRTTPTDRPQDISDFTLLDVTDVAFLFQWDSPKSNGAGITSFNIQCADPDFDDEEGTVYETLFDLSTIPSNGDNDGEEVDNTGDENWQRWIDLSSAEAGTSFECRIQSINSVGTSNGVALASTMNGEGSTADLTLLDEARDTPIRMIAPYQGATAPTASTVNLEIVQGPDQADHTHYNVHARIKKAQNTVSAVHTPGTSVTVTSLNANRAYTFTIQASKSSEDAADLTDADWSPLSNPSQRIRTAAGPPRKNRAVTANAVLSDFDDVEDIDTEELTEQLCQDMLDGVVDYDADLCSAEFYSASVRVTLTVYTLEDTDEAESALQSAITASAVSEAVGSDVASLEVETVAIAVESSTNDAVFLRWPAFDASGSAITAYTLTCSSADPEHGNFTFADELVTTSTISPDGSGYLEAAGAVAGLTASTDYKCRVAATNAQGSYDGTYETEVITTLDAATIVKPLTTRRPTVDSVTVDSASLTWAAPASLGGNLEDGSAFDELTGYSIQYEITTQSDEVQTFVSDGDGVSADVEGLKRGQTYQFRVAGDSTVESGDLRYSAWVQATLTEGTPAAPADVLGTPNGSDSVTLTLQGKDNDGIRIDGGLPLDRYLLQFYPAPADNGDEAAFAAAVEDVDWDTLPEDFDSVASSTAGVNHNAVNGIDIYPIRVEIGGSRTNTQRSYELSGLDPNNADGYLVRYAAVNELGTGEWSEPVVIRTSPQPPTQIQTVTAAAADNTALTVTFSAPSSNGGSEITSYSVSLTQGSAGPANENPGSKTFSISQLTNNGDNTYTASFSTAEPNNAVYRGASYTATVVATNGIGNSDASAASNEATIPSGLAYQPKTVNLSPAEEASSGNTTTWKIDVSASLGWNGGSDYVSVQLDASDPSDNSVSHTIDLAGQGAMPTISHTFTGLSAGVEYTVNTIITNGEGAIEFSNTVTTETTGTPSTSTPTTSTPTGGSTSSTVITPASVVAPQSIVLSLIALLSVAFLF